MPQEKLPEPGEFTRIFKRQHSGAHAGTDAEKQASDASGFHAEPAAASEMPTAQAEIPPPPPPPRGPQGPVPGASDPKSGEPGEFTQYFMGGLPPKPASNPLGTTTQRTPIGVQRPNTPMPPPRSLPSDSSSFTERFAPRQDANILKPEKFGVHNPQMGPPPDLSKRSLPENGGPLDFSRPPSQKEQPGEYTALFGRGNVPPAARQTAVSAPPLAPMMNDSPNSVSGRPLRDVPAASPEVPNGPSEFTVISKGRPTPQTAGGAAPESPSVSGSSSGIKKLPINVNVSPLNPMAALPTAASAGAHLPHAAANMSASGASVTSSLGSASLQAPPVPQLNASAAGAGVSKLTDQTKLILFFGVLAILAVILVVVVVAMQKN